MLLNTHNLVSRAFTLQLPSQIPARFRPRRQPSGAVVAAVCAAVRGAGGIVRVGVLHVGCMVVDVCVLHVGSMVVDICVLRASCKGLTSSGGVTSGSVLCDV